MTLEKTTVIGIGNLLLKDEGAGVHALNTLRERYSFPERVTLIDGGTMGLDLLPFIEGSKNLLLIDAVELDSPPGTIKVIEGKDVKALLDLKFSVHQIGVPDMLMAADLSGAAPSKICIAGIQPGVIETGVELSGELAGKMDDLIDAIIKKLRTWGIEAKENVPCDTV